MDTDQLTPEEYRQLLIRLTEIAKNLKKVLKPFFEAIREMLDAIVEIIREWLDEVIPVIMSIVLYLHREQFYIRLSRFLPPRFARWVAWHWPEWRLLRMSLLLNWR